MWLSFTLPYKQCLDKFRHVRTSFELLPKCSHPIHAQGDLSIEISAGAMEPVARGEAACKQGLGVIIPVLVCVLHADGVDDALADLDGETRRHHVGIQGRGVKLGGVEGRSRGEGCGDGDLAFVWARARTQLSLRF